MVVESAGFTLSVLGYWAAVSLSLSLCLVPRSQPLAFAQLGFYLHDLGDTDQVTSTIGQIREICETFAQRGLPNYPRGIPFTFWEQYMHLRFNLLLALLCVFAAVFFVLTLILLNPWAAVVVVSLGWQGSVCAVRVCVW